MSLAVIQSRASYGINAPLVTVEVHLSNGLPSMSVVGLASAEVKESKERVRSALLNSGFDFPARRIIINLGPADLPKSGGRFDLSIALGILIASEQLEEKYLENFEVLGELALNGELRSVSGVLNATIAAVSKQKNILLPLANASEALLTEAKTIFAASTL
ncbi:MAG: magnesium chelatase family protein, partial [Enterobacterales bacterium]